jgi:RNA recognition motif-containing protein
LFSAYGKVIDVVALKTRKMRGQAFVVFRDLQSATAARRREDGNQILGKPIVSFSVGILVGVAKTEQRHGQRISYANSQSHATVLHEQGPEALYALKMGLHDALEEHQRVTVSGAEKANIDAEKARQREKREREQEEEEEEEEEGDQRQGKRGRIANGHGEEDSEGLHCSRRPLARPLMPVF